MSKLPDKELLRPDEVAKYLGVTRQSIYRWIASGKLEAHKVAGRIIRIPRESVEKCLRYVNKI